MLPRNQVDQIQEVSTYMHLCWCEDVTFAFICFLRWNKKYPHRSLSFMRTFWTHSIGFGKSAALRLFTEPKPHSRRGRKIRSFWRRKKRKRRSASRGWGTRRRSRHIQLLGRGQRRLHRCPVPLLLQPGAALGWTPGGVPTVPAQSAALPLPTTHLLFPPNVHWLPPPVPAHWDIREPGGHCVPAVPGDTGPSGCPRHPGWPGSAGAVWGVPAQTFPGCWPTYTLVPCPWLQVRKTS